ncbi:MAG: peptidoglycan-binding protein [Clostridia bacterium]|nr:peptidoglycan-binding protein [Clostridia bacterium]
MLKRSVLLMLILASVILYPSLSEEIIEIPVLVDMPVDWLDDQPDAVLRAQKSLVALGYLAGGADGVYGPKTEAALRAFQEANALPVTGHLDAQTLDHLGQLASSTASTADIQQRLIDLGYLQGGADGIWGPRSETAMSAFQQMNGLPVTGTADSLSCQALFSGDAVALPAAMYAGAKGDDVLALQQRLAQLGFLSGKADGSYGKQTANAVMAFQRHLLEQGYSITASGNADPVTLFYLLDPDYTSYICDIGPGDTGREVERIETRLASLGYMDATPDTSFDSYAAEALQLFQARARIASAAPALVPIAEIGASVASFSSADPSGVADRNTVDALFSAGAPVAERCALHGIASGDRGLVVEYVEDALLTYGFSSKLPNGRYDSSLAAAIERTGAVPDPYSLSGEAVAQLLDGLSPSSETARVQRRLHTLYYLSRFGIDGKYGEKTRDALRAFQLTNDLPDTGEPDQATLAVLYSADAVARRLPYRVEVSLSDQVVTIYSLTDRGDYEAVRSFPCSTGLHDSTPRGIFLDGCPVNRWHYFKKFNCWAQYSFDIEGDIMFHSVLYREQDESTLRTGSVYALGSPASHGCIRLTVEDAKWLFEHCEAGSLVIIIR